jgi:thioredoxin-related protein
MTTYLRTFIRQTISLMKTIVCFLPVLTVMVVPMHAADGSVVLPWQPDYVTALAKARKEKKPLMVMMSAPWCGYCHHMEKTTLSNSGVSEALEDFVWLKSMEDQVIDAKFGANGYPSFAFADPFTESPVQTLSGYQPAGQFLKELLRIRTKFGMPDKEGLRAAAKWSFEPDQKHITTLIAMGKVDELVAYLAPAAKDSLRDHNVLIMQFDLPEAGKRWDDLVLMVDNQEIGWEGAISPDGIILWQGVRGGGEVSVRATAPGYRQLDTRVHTDDAAVQRFTFTIPKLTLNETCRFVGTVVRSDGTPAAHAIVRICDWATTKADDQGRFCIEGVSPGTFLVRAEAPGGEYHEEVFLAPRSRHEGRIVLKSVPTVGLRWVLQTRDRDPLFSGDGVRCGEAYVSYGINSEHRRFNLARGAQSRDVSVSDFMFVSALNFQHGIEVNENFTTDERMAIKAASPNAPIMYHIDGTGWPQGHHRERQTFDGVSHIDTGGRPDQDYFKMSTTVIREGDVFSVRCTHRERYAKMEIIDITIPNELPPRADAPPDALVIPADVRQPAVSDGEPAPGRLVLQQLPSFAGTEVRHAIWLPEDWTPDRRFPVIVEYLGNTQQVKDGLIGGGMGISGGRGFIWVVLPFISVDGKTDAAMWWGDVAATVAYAKEAVPAICAAWSGDPGRVLLTGHSRGAIACNYIGLHDDGIAKLWRAMVPFSHYDDAHIPWGMTPEEQAKAPERVARLGATPQYILGEQSVLPQPWNDKALRAAILKDHLATFEAARTKLDLHPISIIEGTRAFLAQHAPTSDISIVDLPFVNHSSEVLFRDTPERQHLRAWIAQKLDLPLTNPGP